MITTTFALAQKSYPSDENDSFHYTNSPHTAQHRHTPAEPDFTNHIFGVGCNVSGQDTIDENPSEGFSEFNQQRLLSIFRQHRSCQHTGRANPTYQSHFRVGIRHAMFRGKMRTLQSTTMRTQSQPYARSLFFGPQPLFS